MPEKFGHFCEISSEQRFYSAERLLYAGAYLDHAEISIDEINAKGIVLNQAQIGVVALTQFRLGLLSLRDVMNGEKPALRAVQSIQRFWKIQYAFVR